MKQYIALLRGINVSGKNKIAMSELKSALSESGFYNVATYINSGNIVFSCDINNKIDISAKTKAIIESCFGLTVPAFVMAKEELSEILSNAPSWWGTDDKEIYDNLIFMIPPLTYEDFFCEIGETKKDYEKAANYKYAIFWSFDLKNYTKTNWWSKTANSAISESITIRTANTARKIAKLCGE